MTIVDVTRELLVRYLDAWLPTALRAGKRVTCAYAWSDGDGERAGTAEAALRAFAEFDDLLRTRRLTYLVIAPDVTEVSERLRRAERELGTPANLAVHTAAGNPEEILRPALSAAGTAGAPLFVCAQTATPPVRVSTAGRPVDLLCVLPGGGWPGCQDALSSAGFSLTAGVDLVSGGGAEALIAFGTNRANNLEAFKNALWSVDEYAGVQVRDPRDPDGQLLDITADPPTGPLRRELLAELASGGRTVTQLRHFALTGTVYRATDATRVLTALLHAGAVVTNAPHGRLAGDATVRLAG